jgi:phosphatidylinositol alpha-1,6-mannosyltransferase
VEGDVEGFGMVAIEAAASGTPTVAFDLGGVADAISKENGHLVPPGDYDSFASRVAQVLQSNEPNADQCITHARRFTWKLYNERMRQLIE